MPHWGTYLKKPAMYWLNSSFEILQPVFFQNLGINLWSQQCPGRSDYKVGHQGWLGLTDSYFKAFQTTNKKISNTFRNYPRLKGKHKY